MNEITITGEEVMTQNIKIKGFEIKNIDLESFMREYDFKTKQEAIDAIRSNAIDAIVAQLQLTGFIK